MKFLSSSLLTLLLSQSDYVTAQSNLVPNGPLPNPLPDSCMLVYPANTVCKGNCPPCWVINDSLQINCYDYKEPKANKECPFGVDVSQQILKRANQTTGNQNTGNQNQPGGNTPTGNTSSARASFTSLATSKGWSLFPTTSFGLFALGFSSLIYYG